MEMPTAALAALCAWTTSGVHAVIRNWAWIKMPVALLALLLLAMWLQDGTSEELSEEAGVCTEAVCGPNLTEARQVGRQEAESEALEARSAQVAFEQRALWALSSLLAWAVNALFLYEAWPYLPVDPRLALELCLAAASVMIPLAILRCRHEWHDPALFANLLLMSTTAYFIKYGWDPSTEMRGPDEVNNQVAKAISVALMVAGCLVLPALIHGIVMSAWRGEGDSQWLAIMTILIVTSGVWAGVILLCKKHLRNGRLKVPGASRWHGGQIAALQEQLGEQSQELARAEMSKTEHKKRADTAVEEKRNLTAELKKAQKLSDQQEVLMRWCRAALAETNRKLNDSLTKLATHPQEQAELAMLEEKLETVETALKLEQTNIQQQVVEHGIKILQLQKQDEDALKKLLTELSQMMAARDYAGVQRRLRNELANF